MYSDTRPCEVCGAEVTLRPRRNPDRIEADDTVDERVCTNADCETNDADRSPDAPTP